MAKTKSEINQVTNITDAETVEQVLRKAGYKIKE